MPIKKPYRRTARVFTDGAYSNSGKWKYILHRNYADSPDRFVRSFLLIQSDLVEIFKYIEPSDVNRNTYSHKTHELFLRTCVEVEANCTAILKENGYSRKGDWNMCDYKKIQQSHYLSMYKVKIPYWHGDEGVRTPFSAWESEGKLDWYTSYNNVKHDRHNNFEQANFKNLIEAVCALGALISSQFIDNDFSPGGFGLSVNPGIPDDGFEPAIGEFLQVAYPTDIPDEDKYDFSISDIDFSVDIFQNFVYR
ncbi:hypothetical protein [Saccharophagus degradans]|uniref:Uncharacterized protein n=1 Tax=Saccharophagus degradans TaxID=86304 RepID=A0AAW7X8A9_9GAMM|nr:hypothetical protein [Saccharophagus degradans]MDO6422801.1 hypothetical protein [Saccharophagus degradans]MDO6606274.1 hypothetical protein [Saccharophagus degradans]